MVGGWSYDKDPTVDVCLNCPVDGGCVGESDPRCPLFGRRVRRARAGGC